MRRRKQSFLFIVLFIILFLGIGYASIMTTLTINGTTDFDSNTWNVYWDNVQVTSGSVAASTPTIDTNKTTVSFSVHFTEPGEYYEFTVDAKNDGSIDAMIDTIIKTINNETTIPAYISYTVTYADDVAIEEHQLLKTNAKETYKVRIEYRNDIDPSYLPTTDQSLNFIFGIDYEQADSNGVSVFHSRYVYAIYDSSEVTFTLGSPIPNGAVVYNSIEEFNDSSAKHSAFLRHTVDNSTNSIVQTDTGFIVSDQVYYLDGGFVSEEQYRPIFMQNRDLIRYVTDLYTTTTVYYDLCHDNPADVSLESIQSSNCNFGFNGRHYSMLVNQMGEVGVTVGYSWGCTTNRRGTSNCYYND